MPRMKKASKHVWSGVALLKIAALACRLRTSPNLPPARNWRLLLANTTLEQQMLRVAGSVDRVQLHRLHALAELLAQSAGADGRQLLKVSAYHRVWQVWLLP